MEKAGQDFNFEPLAYISGAGNSSVIQNYIFEDDTEETDEVSYYRLKQVDFNGEYSYSNIIASMCDNTSDNVSVYPNPFVNEFEALFEKDYSNTTILIQTLSGQTVFRRKYQNKNSIRVNLSGYSGQTYIVNINADGKIFTAKLIKND